MLTKVITYAHELMEQSLLPGETAVDGTCGKGNDTIMLSSIVGEHGRVFAFDIQQKAIQLTADRLKKEERKNTTLIQADHQHMEDHLPVNLIGNLGGAIFNLGYLPGSDKHLVTRPESTIQAVDTLVKFLKPGGLIVLVVYHGHPGGALERDALLTHLTNFDQHELTVLRYDFINQKNSPPFLLAVEKNKGRSFE